MTQDDPEWIVTDPLLRAFSHGSAANLPTLYNNYDCRNGHSLVGSVQDVRALLSDVSGVIALAAPADGPYRVLVSPCVTLFKRVARPGAEVRDAGEISIYVAAPASDDAAASMRPISYQRLYEDAGLSLREYAAADTLCMVESDEPLHLRFDGEPRDNHCIIRTTALCKFNLSHCRAVLYHRADEPPPYKHFIVRHTLAEFLEEVRSAAVVWCEDEAVVARLEQLQQPVPHIFDAGESFARDLSLDERLRGVKIWPSGNARYPAFQLAAAGTLKVGLIHATGDQRKPPALYTALMLENRPLAAIAVDAGLRTVVFQPIYNPRAFTLTRYVL